MKLTPVDKKVNTLYCFDDKVGTLENSARWKYFSKIFWHFCKQQFYALDSPLGYIADFHFESFVIFVLVRDSSLSQDHDDFVQNASVRRKAPTSSWSNRWMSLQVSLNLDIFIFEYIRRCFLNFQNLVKHLIIQLNKSSQILKNNPTFHRKIYSWSTRWLLGNTRWLLGNTCGPEVEAGHHWFKM